MSLPSNTLNPLKFLFEMGKLFMKIRRVEKFGDEPDLLVKWRAKYFNGRAMESSRLKYHIR